MSIREKIRNGSDDEGESVLDKLRAGTDNRREFGWPGKPDVKVAVRLLSASESRKARIAAQKEFKDAGLEIGMHNMADFRAQEAAHGLWVSLVDPINDNPLFRSAEDLRAFCTDDELSALADEYNALCEECDPRVHEMSEEDAQALLGMLKKSPDLIHGKVQSLPVAWMLLRTMANQPAT